MDSLRNEAASLDVQGVGAFFYDASATSGGRLAAAGGLAALGALDDTLDGALVRGSFPTATRVPEIV